MKVAIVGAGLSGLSCAFELKKYGIKPTIFEKRSEVGDTLDYAVSTLRIFMKFNGSPRKYLKKNYGLNMVPLNTLKKIVMIGPSNRAILKGNLGYIFKKGLEPYSMENQIAKQVNLPIDFDSSISVDNIKNHFDYIVWATGIHTLSKKLNLWTTTFSTYARVATILGDFKTDSANMWLNREYARNGYGYLLPYGKKKACLSLIVNNIAAPELNYYWKKFWEREKFKWKVLETRDMEYVAGFAKPIKVDNIYFVGNTAGLTENIVGSGAMNAIESGIMAARSMVKNLDYNDLMADASEKVKKNHDVRKFLNTLDNKGFDRLIAFLDLPVIKQIIYNNPLYKTTHSSPIIKLYNKFINNY